MIILFIKLQFFIRYNQAFRPLGISTATIYLNIYLNLSLNPNDLLALSLASSWYICTIQIYLMIPDVYL